MSRLWTRRVLDEAEQLLRVVPKDLQSEYEGVIQANARPLKRYIFEKTIMFMIDGMKSSGLPCVESVE